MLRDQDRRVWVCLLAGFAIGTAYSLGEVYWYQQAAFADVWPPGWLRRLLAAAMAIGAILATNERQMAAWAATSSCALLLPWVVGTWLEPPAAAVGIDGIIVFHTLVARLSAGAMLAVAGSQLYLAFRERSEPLSIATKTRTES